MSKIVKLKDLPRYIAPHLATFTGGVFDLFHIGHLRFLKEASNIGRPLIVAVQSDKSVKIRKGFHRPVFSEDKRAEVIAALEFVDYVVILSGPYHDEKYLKTFMPRFLIFSRENMKFRLQRKKIIEQMFGQMEVVFLTFDKVAGMSTTAVIRRIKNGKKHRALRDPVKQRLFELSEYQGARAGKTPTLLVKDTEIISDSGINLHSRKHSEIEAITLALDKGIDLKECVLITLVPPCINCSKEIIKRGIPKVLYLAPYGFRDGIKLLKANGVEIKRYGN